MSEIRAFVGHSFTPNDTLLVRRFLDFFDTLTKVNPLFSWEHAEAAEPKPISDKVLELLEDKNVFIAICTKKELAISPAKLSAPHLFSKKLSATEDKFEWQTSDWIVQEIGIAIGRKLKLILIIEDGVRDPGSIQADMEYVRFERDAPEKSFEKIAQMIGALTPKLAAAAKAPETTTAERSEKKEEAPEKNSMEPSSDWKEVTYEFSMMDKIALKDSKGEQKIHEAFLSSKFALSESDKALWNAKSEYWRIAFGNKSSLDAIRAIKNANSKNPKIIAIFAHSLSHFSFFADAGAAFEDAASNENNADDSARYRGRAAEKFEKAGQREKAKAILDSIRLEFEAGRVSEEIILKELESFAKQTEDNVLLAATRERIVELWPDRIDTRFNLAYEYSQVDNNNLAFFHYLKIPEINRDAITWNNLGVSYGALGIAAKSVDAFKKSAEDGETLAMSNLGNKYASEGFLQEAREMTKQSVAKENYHKNIGALITRINETSEEEIKKEKETLEKVEPKAQFFRRLGKAVAHPRPLNVGEKWKSPDTTLSAEVQGDEIIFTGSFEKPVTGILSGIAGFGVNRNEIHRFKLTGKFIGRAISGRIERSIDGRQPTLLGLAEGSRKAILIMNSESRELEVIENPDSINPSFYKLVAIAS